MQRQTTFEFDRVFGEHAGQDEVSTILSYPAKTHDPSNWQIYILNCVTRYMKASRLLSNRPWMDTMSVSLHTVKLAAERLTRWRDLRTTQV